MNLVHELDECAKRQLAIAPQHIPHCLESLAAREIERQQAVIAELNNLLRRQGLSQGDIDLAASQEEVIAELLAAAINLRNVAGRYHTEQAFKALMVVVAKHEVKP
jgi:hypothetical protein